MGCRGVDSLRGLNVAPTGWMMIDGVHVVRRDLKRLIERYGAYFQDEYRESTDLVLLGELRDYQLQSDRVGGVDAIEEVYLARQSGWKHVHLVSTNDLHRLLAGERVPCRHIPREWIAMKKRSRASMRRGHL